tara:strand:- start:746 stop:1129 length:384 start_codon:yes stop_codon:yes gene_type:complete
MTVPYTTKWSIYTMQREVTDGYVYAIDVVITGTANDDPTHGVEFRETCRLERPADSLIPYEDLTEEQVIGWVQNEWRTKSLRNMGLPYMEALHLSFESFFSRARVAGGTPWGTSVGIGSTNVGVGTT